MGHDRVPPDGRAGVTLGLHQPLDGLFKGRAVRVSARDQRQLVQPLFHVTFAAKDEVSGRLASAGRGAATVAENPHRVELSRVSLRNATCCREKETELSIIIPLFTVLPHLQHETYNSRQPP